MFVGELTVLTAEYLKIHIDEAFGGKEKFHRVGRLGELCVCMYISPFPFFSTGCS